MNKRKYINMLHGISQKGFFDMFSANALIQIFGFASQLFVVGILSPEDIGRIKIIQTYFSAFSILAMMGFGSSTLKLCSDANISPRRRNAIFQSAFLFTVISSLAVYSIILLVNHFGLLSKDSLIKSLIPLGLFPTISHALFMLLIAYLQANKQMKTISGLTVSNRFISIVGIIGITFFLGIKGYYIAYNVSSVLMILIALVRIKKKYDIRLSGISPGLLPYYFKRHRPYAIATTLGSLFSELSAYLDVILINFFVTDMTDIGYYSFALTLTILYRLLPGTVQQVSLPYFSSSLYDKTSFIRIYQKYNKLLYITVLLTVIGSLLLIPVFVHFIFKAKYDPSITFFIPLSVGWSIRQLTQLQSAALFGLGKAHYMTYTNLIMLFVNLFIVGTALICWGLPGAAYASILTNSIFLICSHTYFRRAINEI